jgi:VIT1/CCC1 family predicted Fe2+/Mn2+ transporter
MHEHRDPGGGWLRPTVFGMMDGLVSNAALIAGISGGHAAPAAISLAGWAGLVAGAVSMAVGEFISVQSSNESTLAEVRVEREALRTYPEYELAELTQLLVNRGVEPVIARTTAEQLSTDLEGALQVHTLTELGVNPRQLPSPRIAGLSSMLAFSAGAFIPLLPYVLGATSFVISGVLLVVALFAAGAVTARYTSRSWWYSGARYLVLGAAAAAVTYGVGMLFHAATG